MSWTTWRARRTFRGSLEQLAHLREFVNETAPQFGCNEEDTFAVELACDEAAANVFSHAFGTMPGEIQVELWRHDNTVTVQMKYHGGAFDPLQVPMPDLDVPLEERPIGGLGLYFMRQLMTEVKFEFDTVNGNVLTMHRLLIPESRG
ncbi:MAG: ATP-binding protein [Chloroflexi bacterium]|nr:ATP-binding protein [Chloroflexota bacterium]